MERRNLVAGLAILIVAIFAFTGTASAHLTHHKKAKKPAATRTPPETCLVKASPSSFMDQGEFGDASSIADVVEVECESVFAEKSVTVSAKELYSRCDKRLYWMTASAFDDKVTGPSFTVTLDNDGNATAVLMGGPRARRAKA